MYIVGSTRLVVSEKIFLIFLNCFFTTFSCYFSSSLISNQHIPLDFLNAIQGTILGPMLNNRAFKTEPVTV